jgi:hypothetical protein
MWLGGLFTEMLDEGGEHFLADLLLRAFVPTSSDRALQEPDQDARNPVLW